MGRPRKQVLDFYIHDVGASADPKITALERRHGNNGWAAYFRLLEILCSQEGIKLDLNEEWQREAIAAKLYLRDSAHLIQVVDYCVTLKLFNKQLWESERIVFSNGLYKRYLTRLEERQQAAERMKRKREAEVFKNKIEQWGCSQNKKVVSPNNHEITNTDPNTDPNTNSHSQKTNVREKHPVQLMEERFKRGGFLEKWETSIHTPSPQFIDWIATHNKQENSVLPPKTMARQMLYKSRDREDGMADCMWQEYQESLKPSPQPTQSIYDNDLTEEEKRDERIKNGVLNV